MSEGRSLVWEITEERPETHRFNAHLFQPDDESDPCFVVGRSDPRIDWPRIQPGPLDAQGGFREHSATVVFTGAPSADQRWHVLELVARERSGPCPPLRATVNGHDALVLPLAERRDRAHDPIPPSPVAGLIHRELWIPPGILTVGENRVVLTTITLDQPTIDELRPQLRPDQGSWFGSTLQWTGLALWSVAEPPPEPAVHIEMLPLYVRRSDGPGLLECVDVVVENLPGHVDATLEIVIGDHRETIAAAAGGCEFGDVRARVEIPEISEDVEATVSITRAGSAVAKTTTRCSPARKWTMHLIPHVHLDLGYTDLQAKVIELHSRNVDKALRILDRQPDWRLAVDGSFVVQNHLRSRSAATRSRAIGALQNGELGLNAFWALPLTGVMGLEDLHRSLYFAAKLRREQGVSVASANVTDVPSYSWAVPSVLAAAGIDGFMGIINHMRGGNADSDELHLRSPVRWVGADGQSVLAFFADCYLQLRFLCADPPTVTGAAESLARFAQRYDRPDYLPHDLPIMGTHSDNEDLSHGYADFVDRWDAAYAWPRVRYSTIADYLHAVRPLRDRLPVVRGDGGSYWEDGVGSQAAATASMRDTQAMLPGVEALTALVTALAGEAVPDLDTLDEAWESLLVATEHTFTAFTATRSPAAEANAAQLVWTRAHVDGASRLAGNEGLRALSQLADLLDVGSVPALLVVNPSSWQRDLVVDVQLRSGLTVQDPDGKPLDVVMAGPAVDGLRDLSVRVPSLPAFGYRALSVAASADPDVIAEPQPVRDEFETPFYRVMLDAATGAVVSLEHKELGVDLLDSASGHTLAEVLYVSGGETVRGLEGDGTYDSLYDYDPTLPPADLEISRAEMRPVGVRRTPWGLVLHAAGSAPTLSYVDVEIELFDDSDRVDVTVTVDKEQCRLREAVYVAFPFAPRNPSVRYERQLGWVDPSADHYAGAGNEWFTTEGTVLVSDQRFTVAWATADAPLFTVSDIVRGRWPTTFTASNGTVFSWVMNNYWWTNTPPDQAGRVQLRYSFTAGRDIDLGAAARLGRNLRQRPLVSHILTTDRSGWSGDEPRPLPSAGQLYEPADADNVVTTIFPGRNGAEFTMRLQETAGRATAVRIRHPQPHGGGRDWAALCSATEDVIEHLELGSDHGVEVEIGPQQVLTLCFGTGPVAN